MEFNLKIFLNKIKMFLKKIGSFFKTAFTVPHSVWYILLLLVLIIFFFFITFPYEPFVMSKIDEIGRRETKRTVVSGLDFNLIGDINLERAEILTKQDQEITLKMITADINKRLSKILKQNYIGEITIKEINFSDKQLKISSKAKTSFAVKLTDKQKIQDGKVTLNLSKIKVEGIQIQGFNIRPFEIKVLNSDFILRKNDIRIKKFVFQGDDLKGKIRGSIQTGSNLNRSRLNLQIEIRKDSGLIKDYEQYLSLLSIDENSDFIKININGFANNPKITYNKKTNSTEMEEKNR